MFPGMGKMNPQQMQGMLRQFGIKSTELKAKRAIFELEGERIVIDNPTITAMDMGGQKIYSVMGSERREKADSVSQEDIDLVATQSGKSKTEAKKALEETDGDIAQAIVKLKGN